MVPVHVSSTSQGPLEDRQITLLGTNTFTGQDELLPVQNSGKSQTPCADRHILSDFEYESTGHVALNPEHLSVYFVIH